MKTRRNPWQAWLFVAAAISILGLTGCGQPAASTPEEIKAFQGNPNAPEAKAAAARAAAESAQKASTARTAAQAKKASATKR